MSGLPREILKWMQSLDLSYSVKNVKRDFANGFLVAEILSRYHKNDSIISLHSFDNGLGLVKRVQNWSLLEKTFKKLGYPIERQLIDQVIHCRKDAAIPLMEQLYTLLTHKTLTSARAQRDQEVVPPFARPTAAQLIKERMSEADLAQAEKLDAKVAPGKAAAVLAEHMHKLKLEKESDPSRFQAPTKSVAAMSVTGRLASSKKAPSGDSFGRGAAAAAPASPQPQSKGYSQLQTSLSPSPAAAASAFAPVAPASPMAPMPPGATALQTLSGSLLAILGHHTAEAQRLLAACAANQEPIQAFAESEALLLQDGHLAYVLAQLSAQTCPQLTELSLQNPREFWHTSGILLGLLEKLGAESLGFGATITFFSQLGLRLVHRDAAASTALFMDFSFQRFVQILSRQGRKVFAMSRSAYAFLQDTPEAHGKFINGLRDSLVGGSDERGPATENGWRTFYAIVAALAPFEGTVLGSNNFQLLNSYLKLVQEGLKTTDKGNHSPRVRATALSILAPLAANATLDEKVMRVQLDIIRGLLPKDGDLITARRGAHDEWVLDAELLHVLSCALSHPWVLSSPSVVEELSRDVEGLLRAEGVPYATVRAGISHLTHVLGSQPTLRRVWMNRLLEDDVLRGRVLGTAAGEEASHKAGDDPAPDLAQSFCPPLRAVWHPLTVAQSLGDQVRVAGLDNLTLGHIELLDAASEDAFGPVGSAAASDPSSRRPPFPDTESAEWSALFLQLRDHLVVELCEEKLCEMVINILRRFILDPRTQKDASTIFLPVAQNASAAAAGGSSAPPIYCIMRFMFPSAAEDAQLSLAGFLEELALYPSLIGLVHRVLLVFNDNEGEKMAASPLGPLLAKLDSQAAQAGVGRQ